jgi:hypothetical protein
MGSLVVVDECEEIVNSSTHFCDELDDMDEFLGQKLEDRNSCKPLRFFDRLVHLCSFGSVENEQSEIESHVHSVLQNPGRAKIPQNRACLNLAALHSHSVSDPVE